MSRKTMILNGIYKWRFLKGLGALGMVLLAGGWVAVTMSTSSSSTTVSTVAVDSESAMHLQAHLYELGYTPESCAAIGLSESSLSAILSDVADWGVTDLDPAIQAHGRMADAMIQADRIRRSQLRGEGLYSSEDLAAQETALVSAQTDRDRSMSALQSTIETRLNASQVQLMARIDANRMWNADPEYRVVDIPESDWIVVQKCRRMSDQDWSADDGAIMARVEGISDFIAAASSRAANEAAVATTWENFWGGV